MKKIIYYLIIFFLIFSSVNIINVNTIFATPESAINREKLVETLLMKLQGNNEIDSNVETMYKYLDILCQENTQFFSYKIKEIEDLMDNYRENIILKARELATKKEYKEAVEFLESKSQLFKDKKTIYSLITHYSKFFVKDGLFYCEYEPEIISINKLIAYPLVAFTENANSEKLNNLYLTTKEFSNLLNELYINNYVLIDIFDYLDIQEENIFKRDIYLPLNKKPLILMFNHINYHDNENCFIDKFIIDPKDKVATFSSKQTEQNQISYTADFIPILENFIDENKDFSQNNARSIISFDKNDNILGYNISKTNPNLNNDLLTLKKLMANLKTKGYKFAFSNPNVDISNLEEEITYIKDTIFNISPNINIYVSPSNNVINNYYKELNKLGFKVFIDTSDNKLLIKYNFAFLSCTQINGNFLRKKGEYLGLNFDKIYDHNNRPIIY